MTRLILPVLVLLIAALPGRTQNTPDRFELGQRFRAFEKALAAQTDTAVRTKVLTAMKSITFTFLSGQLARAAQMLDEARRGLESDKPDAVLVWADVLKVRP